MPSEKRSCAFFDLDGTMIEGFMIQSFPRFLADKGIVDSDYPDRIDEIIEINKIIQANEMAETARKLRNRELGIE